MIRILLAALALTTPAAAQTPWETYGSACLQAVGPVPSFDCNAGVTIPITVDGTPVADRAPATCDRPSLLDNGAGSDGQCVPFSRILNLSTETAQIAVMCRQKKFRRAGATEYDEIDVIAHNPASGATCWFQASARPGRTISGVDVPSPTSATDGRFWKAPEKLVKVGCGVCHDNDPFMYSPFVGQVWAHVPVNPFGPYAHVDAGFGFGNWPTTAMDMRDNTCTGCHRIGSGLLTPRDPAGQKPGSCGTLASWMTGLQPPPGADPGASAYPGNHAMPPDLVLSEHAWNTIYAHSSAMVQSCCSDPTQDICGVTEIRSYLEAFRE